MAKREEGLTERLIESAKQEFLKNGFQGASLRTIAENVGTTTRSIYIRYKDKEELFASLVEPVLSEWRAQFEVQKEKDYSLLEQKDLETMWANSVMLNGLLDNIYANYDIFKLVICCSEGTKYANYIHEFVLLNQVETEKFMDAARTKGIAVKNIKEDELHLLLSAYITAIFEMVVHDYKKEDAGRYLRTLYEFFVPGWRAVLGL